MNESKKSSKSVLAQLRFWYQNRQSEKQHIDSIVEVVEPKIRQARGYRKQLRGPIQICREHCKAIVAGIPGPIQLKASDYHANPIIRAAFVDVDELTDLLAKQEVSLKSAEPEGDERCALLTMTHREATVFGAKQQGEMILSDAKMKSITFTDHKIVALSTTLEASRNKLEEVCFQMILQSISKEIAARRTNLLELREHLQRLDAMAEIFSSGTSGENAFGHVSLENLEKLEKVEEQLKESKDELVRAKQGNETPEDWLALLVAQLSRPDKIMNIQSFSLRLDWRNVITDAPEEKANLITLAQCMLTDELKREAVLISYSIKTH